MFKFEKNKRYLVQFLLDPDNKNTPITTVVQVLISRNKSETPLYSYKNHCYAIITDLDSLKNPSEVIVDIIEFGKTIKEAIIQNVFKIHSLFDPSSNKQVLIETRDLDGFLNYSKVEIIDMPTSPAAYPKEKMLPFLNEKYFKKRSKLQQTDGDKYNIFYQMLDCIN